MSRSLTRNERIGVSAIAVVAGTALYVGWRVFWFLCDDAFIAFRYVSNSRLGWGYVWNAPPFQPVEGYTSFLWVVSLDAFWRLTRIEPPDAANGIALACSFVSLGLILALGVRMRLPAELDRWRVPLVGIVAVGTVTNRTFLTWSSSGLETALMTMLVLGWIYAALFCVGGRGRALLAAVAAAISLCRPDGLLFVVATVLLLGIRARSARRNPAVWTPGAWLAMLPLLIALAHLVWRRATYGHWLPNTYYAKVVSAWPQGGLVYAASFLWEYAYSIWVVVAVAAALRAGVGVLRAGGVRRLSPLLDERQSGALVVILVLALHSGYYTLVVGGDHFEYRIYHHLVPLALLSFPWLCGKLGWSARRTVASFVAMLAIGCVLPWLHWWHTHNLQPGPTGVLPESRVAEHLPTPVRWYGGVFDGLQDFLFGHFSGIRHQDHKNFWQKQIVRWPSRAEGSGITSAGIPVRAESAAGVPGWVLPHVAVIDLKGLSDSVIARNPVRSAQGRWLAHERTPPPGYVECFRPNVALYRPGAVAVVPRKDPLTAAEVVRCEEDWLARVGSR